jgi:hypothetical protein
MEKSKRIFIIIIGIIFLASAVLSAMEDQIKAAKIDENSIRGKSQIGKKIKNINLAEVKIIIIPDNEKRSASIFHSETGEKMFVYVQQSDIPPRN